MKVSVVIPLLNEVDNLKPLYARLVALFEKLKVDRELIFVDDGSTDGSFTVIEELAAADPTVLGISFSRNFGHEPASTAGLDRATGDVVSKTAQIVPVASGAGIESNAKVAAIVAKAVGKVAPVVSPNDQL